MRGEFVLNAATSLRWLPEGATALTVGVLASAGSMLRKRRSCGWLALALVGLALRLVEEPLVREVWPQLMHQAVQP